MIRERYALHGIWKAILVANCIEIVCDRRRSPYTPHTLPLLHGSKCIGSLRTIHFVQIHYYYFGEWKEKIDFPFVVCRCLCCVLSHFGTWLFRGTKLLFMFMCMGRVTIGGEGAVRIENRTNNKYFFFQWMPKKIGNELLYWITVKNKITLGKLIIIFEEQKAIY